MRIKFMHRNAINCKVLIGAVRNKRIFIPLINLTYSGTILKFNLQRTQSPIIPALAMAISLKDKHLKNWNIFESARVRSLHGLRFYISEYSGQGHLANDECVFIKKNIVYREVLNL